MPVPVRARDAKILHQMEQSGDPFSTCDRCHTPLGPPSKPGFPRKDTNARVVTIVSLSSGGTRTMDNLTILCGPCKEMYQTVGSSFIHKSLYTSWLDTYDPDEHMDTQGDQVQTQKDFNASDPVWEGVDVTNPAQSGDTAATKDKMDDPGTSADDAHTPDTHNEGVWSGSTGADQTFFKEEDKK